MSRIVLYDSLFVERDVIHWNSALIRTVTAIIIHIFRSASKSTFPLLIITSTPLPIRIGTKSDSTTPINAQNIAEKRCIL